MDRGTLGSQVRRGLLWTSSIAAVLWWGFALVMALLEVVHLAQGQSTEHAAGVFAGQALVVAAVSTAGALVTARSGVAAQV